MTHACPGRHTRDMTSLRSPRVTSITCTLRHAENKKYTENLLRRRLFGSLALRLHGRLDVYQKFSFTGANDYRGRAPLGSEYTSRRLQDARSQGHCSAKGHATLNLLTALRALGYQQRRKPQYPQTDVSTDSLLSRIINT